MKNLERDLSQMIKEYGTLDFPGGMVHAYRGGRKIVDISYGKTWPVYDLASLTKVLFTTSVVMQLVEAGKLSLGKRVQDYLPWYRNGKNTITQLLNHTAGNVNWYPFYKHVPQPFSPEERFCSLQRLVRKRPLKRQLKAVYSDIDFFLLGSIIEKVEQRPLVDVWQSYKETYLPETGLHFCYDNKPSQPRNRYAPTEKCGWRKMTMQGQVHDENAWSIGGVAPHAGLFGDINDIANWALKIRQDYFNDSKNIVSKRVLRLFTKASMLQSRGSWGLGFMKPSKKSTAGQYFSGESYGHTGFTGMSLWTDPKKDLIVINCSNRVNPTRKNRDFLLMRPRIHDFIVEYLEGR